MTRLGEKAAEISIEVYVLHGCENFCWHGGKFLES
jgi:hypothetical protein